MDVEFRKIRKQDVYKFADWGSHSDPRFYQYNFPFSTKEEFDDWYHMKQRWLFRKVYGLFWGDYPLGFVTLKNIKWLKREAELGIAIDPNHLNEGYGERLLDEYLMYVFQRFPLKRMLLRVAVFNERAKHCYEKVGFVEIDRRMEVFEEQGFKDLILQEHPEIFKLFYGELCTEFVIMAIDKSAYFEKNCL